MDTKYIGSNQSFENECQILLRKERLYRWKLLLLWGCSTSQSLPKFDNSVRISIKNKRRHFCFFSLIGVEIVPMSHHHEPEELCHLESLQTKRTYIIPSYLG